MEHGSLKKSTLAHIEGIKITTNIYVGTAVTE